MRTLYSRRDDYSKLKITAEEYEELHLMNTNVSILHRRILLGCQSLIK